MRPFQDVLIDLGARLACRAWWTQRRQAEVIPAAIPTTSSITSASPASASLAGWRGADGDKRGHRRSQSEPARRYIDNGCFWRHELPAQALYFKPCNRAYLDWAVDMGFHRSGRNRSFFSSTASRCRSFASPRAAMATCSRRTQHRDRIETYFDPLPFWYTPFEEASDRRRLSAARHHAAADGDVPLWGSQNAWLRQIHGENRLHIHRELARCLGIADDDWVTVSSASWRDQGAGQADGRRQSRHGLDLERHRQAVGRLESRTRRARIQTRLPPQPSHRAISCLNAMADFATPTRIR